MCGAPVGVFFHEGVYVGYSGCVWCACNSKDLVNSERRLLRVCRAPLSSLTVAERRVAVKFYRDIAEQTTGKFAPEARLYNLEQARFLEQGGPPIPPTLLEFIKTLKR